MMPVFYMVLNNLEISIQLHFLNEDLKHYQPTECMVLSTVSEHRNSSKKLLQILIEMENRLLGEKDIYEE